MFAKLCAQEWRDNGPNTTAVLGIHALIGATSLGVAQLDVPVLSFLLQAVAIGTFISAPIVVLIRLHVAYWQSMYGSRGYFTMTLPVKGRCLYWAKSIFAFLFILLALVLTATGLVAVAWSVAHSNGMTLGEFFQPLRDSIANMPSWILLYVLISFLVSIAFLVFPVMAVMSIGAQSRWNHMGFGAPMIGMVLLYLVGQIAVLIGMILPGAVDLQTGQFTWDSMLFQLINAMGDNGAQPSIVGLGSVVASAALTSVMAWWGIRSIERHTSLR